MRLGGPLHGKYGSPEEWLKLLARKGYRAAYCPLEPGASDAAVRDYARAAERAGVVIAEIGAWGNNPIAEGAAERERSRSNCRAALALADAIGARCCVNVAGSRGSRWAGPDARNLTGETFDMIVESVRDIVDAVKPVRTCYALETMPWMYPDSVESYERLVGAVDRKAFAVHFDPVNLVSSPQRYAATGGLIREFCRRLGPRIKSCHAKDIVLADKLTVHLDECRPGAGALDYRTLLAELSRLDKDTPLMLEHLRGEEEYDAAAAHVRAVAAETGVSL